MLRSIDTPGWVTQTATETGWRYGWRCRRCAPPECWQLHDADPATWEQAMTEIHAHLKEAHGIPAAPTTPEPSRHHLTEIWERMKGAMAA